MVLPAFGTKTLLAYPDVIEQIAPIDTLIFLIVSVWLVTQLGHARAKVVDMRAERV